MQALIDLLVDGDRQLPSHVVFSVYVSNTYRRASLGQQSAARAGECYSHAAAGFEA
jgi:hypothetical protein